MLDPFYLYERYHDRDYDDFLKGYANYENAVFDDDDSEREEWDE